MIRFSANLGFLWQEQSLPDAIRSAKTAGFDAVECHWPYDVPASQVKAALDDTGLSMLGINTWPGQLEKGEIGLAALPGREEDARAAIDEAIEYAITIDARNIHVMAGQSEGQEADQTFKSNLLYACNQAAGYDLTILVEPLNRHDNPDYFLKTTDQAVEIICSLNQPNLQLMFDCYHVQRTEGDVNHRLRQFIDFIGHIQFASSPDRGRPDQGELDYRHVFSLIKELGYDRPLGAEYRPEGRTEDSLGWMAEFRHPV